MYPLSDKDLDRMSREASDQTDVDISPAGWERLEQRLNKELPGKKDKDRRRFLWIFFFAILLSGSGLVYLLNGADKTITPTAKSDATAVEYNPEVSQKNTPDNQQINSGTTTGSQSNEKENTIEDSKLPNDPSVAPDLATGNNTSATSTDKINTETKINREKFSSIDKSNPSISISTKKKLSARRSRDPHKKLNEYVKQPELGLTTSKISKKKSKNSETKVDLPSVDQQNKETINNTTKNAEQITSSSLPVVNNDSTSTTKIEKTPAIQPGDNNQEPIDSTIKSPDPVTAKIPESKKPKTPESNLNRFAIGIFAGTDLSNINGSLKNKAGYSVGVQASYNITRRLSINTGFSVTKKFYEAKGSDFHPPAHYFTYYVDKLVRVDGSCFMWELPLTIRYDVLSTPKINWYLNGGVSSYIMRKQNYRYDYIYNNNPASKDWSSSSQQNEWLKIVNLSTGLEYKMNKIWSLQAEPYLKLPTSGLGFGKMDISSYGLTLGLRYRPNFKK